MKYCTKCGAEIADEAVLCPKCGCSVEKSQSGNVAHKDSTLTLIIKVFMVIGCVAYGWAIVPLFWCVPMTIHYWNCARDGKQVGLLFKICTFLFVNLIAGVLMLIDND